MTRSRVGTRVVGARGAVVLSLAIAPVATGGTPQFSDQTVAAGIDLVQTPAPSFAFGPLNAGPMVGGGAVGDFNRDGWPDLFMLGCGATPDRLYLNNRDGTFTDHAATVLDELRLEWTDGTVTRLRNVPANQHLDIESGNRNDVNDDGDVTPADLLTLLELWDTDDARGDLNADDRVDILDLLLLLRNL